MTDRPDLPPYRVRRSARARSARLTVTAIGDLEVVLPSRMPLAAAPAMVAQHLPWVERQLARAAATRHRLETRPPLLDGRRIEIHGIPHTVRQAAPAGGSPARRGRVERHLGSDDDGLAGDLLVHPGDRDPAVVLEAWLREEARRILAGRVAARAPAMAVTPGRLTVRAQSSRWGSASRDGSLSFNWRLLLAPPFVLDAVVVHELAHLRIRGHGAPFWALVRAHAPRTTEARAWLRTHHAELMAALD